MHSGGRIISRQNIASGGEPPGGLGDWSQHLPHGGGVQSQRWAAFFSRHEPARREDIRLSVLER